MLQKKFMLCAAWIGEPKVLLFDEPSNALDLSARAELADIFVETASDSTLLFTSHDAEFVSATSATVVTMDEILSSSSENGG
jgi:ABC-2 type transport system ATP-binding protein